MVVVDDYWAHVDVGDWQDCWLWTAATSGNGYGHLRVDDRMRPAHRVGFELVNGPIPDGLELDHVKDWGCTSTLCCNPLHLEPVTHAENVRRVARHRTHCRQGHEYTGENLRVSADGARHCRTCDRAYASRSNTRRAAHHGGS